MIEELKYDLFLSSLDDEKFEKLQRLVKQEVRNRRIFELQKIGMTDFQIAVEEATLYGEFDLITPFVLEYMKREEKSDRIGDEPQVTAFYEDMSTLDSPRYRVIFNNYADDTYLITEEFIHDHQKHLEAVKLRVDSENKREIAYIQNRIEHLKTQLKHYERFV
jgi:hypothetical protein